MPMAHPPASPIYLDHNATTPVDPKVWAAIEPHLTSAFGNPSSVEHEHGHLAALAVDRARQQVAKAIGAQPKEIVFTGSSTEANNLAILGVARASLDKKHIITSAIEHPSVLEPCRALERQGWRVTYLPVDDLGRVSLDALNDAISPETVLVSIMAANNEVGTLHPITAIGALCAERNVLFHTDMAQLIAYGHADVVKDNIHLATLSAHKAYGPKGIGALYVRARRPRPRLEPMIFGGGQERGLRPGTLNTPFIVGMGAAFELAAARWREDSARLRTMCNAFRDTVLTGIPGALLNGHPSERLASNISFSIPGVEPLALIRSMREHASFSASSACATDKVETSHVLRAMFGETPRARQAFRISPGRFTAEADFQTIASLIVETASGLRRMAA
ncbi:MAG: aminotransferase class V-fold PLP-dependent enzyme [Alphaproteobacteria bacterium]